MTHNTIEQSRKESRISAFNQEVKICNHILGILDECKAVIRSYDGKVLNRRLIVSLNGIQPNPHKIHFSFGCQPGWSEDAVKISDHNNRCYSVGDKSFYLSSFEEYITLVTDTPAGGSQPRLDARRTIENLETLREQLQKDIQSLQSDIDNYDKEAEAWQTIKAMVEDYQSTYSYRLRGTVNLRR